MIHSALHFWLRRGPLHNCWLILWYGACANEPSLRLRENGIAAIGPSESCRVPYYLPFAIYDVGFISFAAVPCVDIFALDEFPHVLYLIQHKSPPHNTVSAFASHLAPCLQTFNPVSIFGQHGAPQQCHGPFIEIYEKHPGIFSFPSTAPPIAPSRILSACQK
jgi:hypothetical protein